MLCKEPIHKEMIELENQHFVTPKKIIALGNKLPMDTKWLLKRLMGNFIMIHQTDNT